MDEQMKLVVWGTASIAHKCTEILAIQGRECVAYCDNNDKLWGETFYGKEIISPVSLKERCVEENIEVLVANQYFKQVIEQISDYEIDKLSTYQDLFVDITAEEISDTYALDKEYVVNQIQNHYEELYSLFEGAVFSPEMMERAMEEFVPELKKKYKLSVCAILKNEGEYIKQWLEFHRMVGVEHFYLYDNESTDDICDILSDYITQGIVTYQYWAGKVQQLPAYQDALDNYKYQSKYIAFIDLDEYLMPVKGKDLFQTIDEIMLKYSPYAGGIGVNWKTYGTSFHEDKVEGLLFENYKYRTDDCEGVNKHIKTVCNPRKVIRFKDPHSLEYRKLKYCINSHVKFWEGPNIGMGIMKEYCAISENGSYIPGAFFNDGIGKKLVINHYYTKSKNEYIKRLKQGKPDRGCQFTEEDINNFLKANEEQFNSQFDDSALRFVPELKARLGMEQ